MEKKRTHEAGGVGGVSPDLAIDLDQALHDNRGHLLAGQSIFETVAEEDGEGKAFAELVGTGRGAGGLHIDVPLSKSLRRDCNNTHISAAELVEHP